MFSKTGTFSNYKTNIPQKRCLFSMFKNEHQHRMVKNMDKITTMQIRKVEENNWWLPKKFITQI
jgi:hypothetical protein